MIYITGDIHREQDIHKINPREFEAGNHLTPDDYVIICGDFGCIWDGGSGDRFWLNWLESLPWNTLFIDGNHENFDVLNTYPIVDYKGGKARQIRSNIFHLLRGEVYDIGGRSFFTFGGAFSHDVQYRTEHLNWWQDELPTKEECENGYRNLNACNWKVDYVLTHDVYESHPMAGKYEKSMDHYDASRQDIQKYLDDIVVLL
ncbi:metallophosphoesterase, partial [Faecalibaculum rodentium]|uniref:metallophosphoesterase n=1 Tax=Faecalibaculum rodentium TaxID=1702221 RepID=UPI002603D3A0